MKMELNLPEMDDERLLGSRKSEKPKAIFRGGHRVADTIWCDGWVGGWEVGGRWEWETDPISVLTRNLLRINTEPC